MPSYTFPLTTEIWLDLAEKVIEVIRSEPGLPTYKILKLVPNALHGHTRQVLADLEASGRLKTYRPTQKGIYPAGIYWYSGKKTP